MGQRPAGRSRDSTYRRPSAIRGQNMDERLIAERFRRSAAYNPDWVLAGVSGAAHPQWMAEWLAGPLDLRPGMWVLDLGCGRALSSVFLRREFGVHADQDGWAVEDGPHKAGGSPRPV